MKKLGSAARLLQRAMDNLSTDPGSNEGGTLAPETEYDDEEDSKDAQLSKDSDSVRSHLEVPGKSKPTATTTTSRIATANRRRKRARTAGKTYDAMMASRTRLVGFMRGIGSSSSEAAHLSFALAHHRCTTPWARRAACPCRS